MNGIFTDIVLIDSGVDSNHETLKEYDINGIMIKKDNNGNYAFSEDISDSFGHGTAIYYILKKENPLANIFVIKLFENDLNVELEDIIFALKFIKENINCKIIHMSLGISYCDNRFLFEKVCDEIYKKGIFIVSAFDNLGTLSYPAAFKNVIGVDMAIKNVPRKGYQYVEGSTVNIRILGKQQYLPTCNNKYSNLIGSSFFAPYITSLIYRKYQKGNIKTFLKKNASEINNKYKINYKLSSKYKHQIKRAVIFPFNKEMHSIVSHSDLCDFKIHEIYDIKYFGNINKKVSDILPFSKNESVIKNIDKIDWTEPFDTFIVGHIQEIDDLTNKNYMKKIIENCIKYNKFLYTISDISKYLNNVNKSKLKFYYPTLSNKHINNTFNKMRCISKPILAIMGTSPKQGKYTLQLLLRKKFLNNGYKVGQLGTEETGLLFGFDEIYPCGYNSSVNISGDESIYYVNKLLSNIELKNPDIIIIGTQSQTIHYGTGNLGFYNIKNTEILLGSDPDGILLVVNHTDSVEYIQRTIANLEIVHESTVIALVVFPMKKTVKWSVLGSIYQENDKKEIIDFKMEIEKVTMKKCYIFDNKVEIENIFEKIVDFFYRGD